MLRPTKRGFALIAALLMTAATVAIAVGLYVAASGARAGAVHTASGEYAEVIAKAGMERTEAWALEATKREQDFDQALDPNLGLATPAGQAVCTNLQTAGTPTETGNMNIPVFTDGAIITYQAKRWRRVSYQGGAYLVRIDDNDDDTIAAPSGASPDWSLRTTNNVGTTGCYEGPTAPTTGANGVENKARDRDRVIWATVIGIYPGTDPATAVHRSVMRKMLIDNRIIGPSAMNIGGTLAIANGGAGSMCTEVSGVTAGGVINTGSPGSCGCGTVSATTVTLTGGSPAGDCGACCGDNDYAANPGAATPTLTVGPTNQKWYDWSSPCNFYMQPTGATAGLYFWDPTAARGVLGNCASYVGGPPAPSAIPTANGACWVPLFTISGTGGSTTFATPIAALGSAGAGTTQEVFAGTGSQVAAWKPRYGAVGYNLTGYYSSAAAGTKPDWRLCPTTSTTDFRWNPQSADPGSGTESIGCTTTTCDGNHETWSFHNTAPLFRFSDNIANAQAFPTGVYVHNGDLTVDNNGGWTGTLNPSTNWPMMTFAVIGNLTLPNSKRLSIGVGTRKNEFPSVIVGGNLVVNNGARYTAAGSTYVTGNLSIDNGGSNGGAFLFGKLSVNGNLSVANGGRLNWDYDVDLDALTIVPPPVPRLSTPISF